MYYSTKILYIYNDIIIANSDTLNIIIIILISLLL